MLKTQLEQGTAIESFANPQSNASANVQRRTYIKHEITESYVNVSKESIFKIK